MAMKDTDIRAAIEPYLESEEQLKHWAFGVKQPNMLLIIVLFALAVLPGAIALALLTKTYVVGLTNRRFLVLRLKGKMKVTEISEYPLGALPEVKASTGLIFTHIRIRDPQQPFVAKFHRAGMKNNREHSLAIATALTGC